MKNIEFLSQAWFEKTIANNLQLLSEITATAACGIWLQPLKASNQLWVSASFFKFLGLELNTTSAGVKDLKKTIVAILSEVSQKSEITETPLQKTFTCKTGNAILVNIFLQEVTINDQPGLLYQIQRYEQKSESLQVLDGFSDISRLFNEASELARVGGWEVDLVNNKVSWTRVTKKIHEVPDDYEPTLEEGINYYKEGQSRDTISELVQKAIQFGTPWDAELQLVTAKNREIWVRALGKAEFKEGVCVRLYGAFQDINERKIAQLDYNVTKERFEKIVQNSAIGIILVHVDGHLLLANPASLKIFGFQEEQLNEALKLTFRNFIHPDFLEEAINYRAQLIAGAIDSYQMEAKFYRIDRVEIWCRLSVSLVKGEDGIKDRIISQVEDITERKHLEFKAKEHAKRFTTAFEYSPNGMGMVSIEGDWLMVNQNLASIFGYKKEEFINKRSSELTHPDDLKKDSKQLKALINLDIDTYSVEKRFVHRSGKIIHGLLNVSVVTDEQGTPLYLIGQISDLSKRVKAEQALQKSLTEFQQLMNATTKVSIMETNLEGIIQKFNKGAENLLGYTAEEVVGKMNVSSFHIKKEFIEREADHQKFYDAEWTYKRKDGSTFPVKLVITPVHNETGDVFGYLGVAIDISNLKEMEYSLVEARKKAEAANRSKSEFLANMSHEIRTPLNGIIGFTDLLMQTTLTPSQQKYMQTVHNSANTLMDLINDILDFSKIEAGKLELNEERTDLIELCTQTVDIVKHQAHQKGLEMLLQISPDVKRFVQADSIRLRQILINLLGNAVKFTDHGEVALIVTASNTIAQENEAEFKFEIRDTGIGIDPKNINKIFNAFDQEDVSTTRKYGGSGLGLTISNRLLNLMGSKLKVNSIQGTGSTFYFDLKLKTEKEPIYQSHNIKEIKKVLVVDDNATNREILAQMLAVNSIETVLCTDAIDALSTLGEQDDFDLAIVDFNMPYLNGIGLIKEIRNTHKLNSEKLPVILLHSATEDELIQKSCKELGVAYNITKPIQINQLYELLEGIGTGKTTPVNKDQEAFKTTTEAFKILIVEDNPVNRFLANSILKKIAPNAKLISAVNGKEAIKKFKKNKPDIIFMDIQMPILSGIEAAIAIRELENASARTPIIALTARALKNEREKCLAIGMDDYLTKPIVLDDLRSVLFKHLILGKSFQDQ